MGTPVVAAVAAQRGRAWRKRDSILLVKTYEWIEETRKGTRFFVHSVLTKGNESQPIQDNNMYKYWLSLDPNETGQTSTSVIARWKDMVSMFKYVPYCILALLIVDSLSLSMTTRLLAQPAVQSGLSCLLLNKMNILNGGPKATQEPKR